MSHLSLSDYAHWLQSEQNMVLLEDTYSAQTGLLFVHPVAILQIYSVTELPAFLSSLQEYRQQGYYLAGYFAYECGYFIEKLGLQDYTTTNYPLAWFGVYSQSHRLDAPVWDALQTEAFRIDDLHFDVDRASYREKVERIREHIRAGDVYQINFTGRYRFTFDGSPLSFYAHLRHAQRTKYSAYLRAGSQDILCFSPELFFEIDGQRITTRPMKGTAKRGRTVAEDIQQREWLQQDQKNRAENVMIVDLLRNDLGRICIPGSVDVSQMFHVEHYQTLLQMTSTVNGSLAAEKNVTDIFYSLFPCGSITGAPKIKAMEIIKQLEDTPRGVYTGAIGFIAPQSDSYRAMFNVAIRTITLAQGQGTMGIGSGIVYDSDADQEFAECEVKARFLTGSKPDWQILETLLWQNGYQRLDRHLARMRNSAHYFHYPYREEQVQVHLQEVEEQMLVDHKYRVRLLLDQNGKVVCQVFVLEEQHSSSPLRVIVSSEKINSQDAFYFHKTTHRPLYEQASRFAREHGYADVIFLNERGEITEGAISTIFIEREGKLLTPPVSCGLLAGVYRQYLLDERPDTQEAVLTIQDLIEAEHIFLCNSVRGLREVSLCHPDELQWHVK